MTADPLAAWERHLLGIPAGPEGDAAEAACHAEQAARIAVGTAKPLRFTADGMTLAIHRRVGNAPGADLYNQDYKTRARLLAEHPRYADATRIYCHFAVALPVPPNSERGDDPANDARWDAYNAAEVKAMRDKAARAAVVLAARGVHIGDPDTLMFSRNAGCAMCPCSPGLMTAEPVCVDGVPIDAIYIDY